MGKNKKYKIHFVHLLNDYSGSPRVLKQIISYTDTMGIDYKVWLGSKSKGHLSGFYNATRFNYSFSKYKIVTVLKLLIVQIKFFIAALIEVKKNDVVYINTLLPIGFSLGGYLKGGEIIYHIHETSINKILKRILVYGVKKTSSKNIFVSNFLKKKEDVLGVNSEVVYNSLDESFKRYDSGTSSQENILMLCSLKEYKGVHEFISLAKMLPQFSFELVLNASKEEVDRWLLSIKLTNNLKVYSRHKEVFKFYQRAKIVLNLSQPDNWVETFGLTVIEANYFGVPVIVPPVGGIAEIVIDDVNGYKISSKNLSNIKRKIEEISYDDNLHKRLKDGSLHEVDKYDYKGFGPKILNVIKNGKPF